MGQGKGAAVSAALGSALRLRFASLPTRIIVPMFAAALVTGLAVTWISTRSTEAFLRAQIDERFPELLQVAAGELDRWYQQRELDLATFASSQIVAETLRPRPAPERARGAARRYLAYVQEGFPQYGSLFALDAAGREAVWVGERVPLPQELREQLGAVDTKRVSDVLPGPAGLLQVVSAPVGSPGEGLGTLHALLPLAAARDRIGGDDLGARIGLYVLGPDGEVLLRSAASPDRNRLARDAPSVGATPAVADYTLPDGEHVVGGAMRFGRFGWTLLVEQDYDVAFAPVLGVIRKVAAINLCIVLAFGLLALWIARSIVQPIRALSEGARRIAQGDADVDLPQAVGQDEIAVLSRAFRAMVARLSRNQVELQRKQRQIEHANQDLLRANEDLHRNNEMLEQLSFTDGLTHLHNHRYFQERLRVETKRADRGGEPLAMLLIDIDDFKLLNDRHGHAVGDEVLRRVAAILNGTVRETDLPARYGGEEFVVLAPRTELEGALGLAEKLRELVSATPLQQLGPDAPDGVRVSVSIGVSLYGGDAVRFFNEADRALYQAKGSGKDCVVHFEPGATG